MNGVGPALLVPALGQHYGVAAPGDSSAPVLDPLEIFGTASPGVMFFGRADTVVEAAGVVSGLPNKATYGPASLAQATSSKRPSLITYGGLPALRFDGVDDHLTGTIPAGGTAARSFMWLVGRCHTLRATVDYMALGHTGVGGMLAPVRQTATHFTAFINPEIITGPARDTAVHLFDAAFTPTTSARYRVDGVGYNGAGTGGSSGIDQLTIGAWLPPESNNAACDIFEVGFCNHVPSTEQYAALDAYARARYSIML